MNYCNPKFFSCFCFVVGRSNLLTLESVYGIFVLGFRPKKQQFSVALPTP